jgi:hypothetical protein
MLHSGLTLLQRRVCSAGQGRSGQKRRQEEQGAHPKTAIISPSCHHDALWCAVVIAAAAQLPHQPQRCFTQRVCPFTSAAAVQRDFPTTPPLPSHATSELPFYRNADPQPLFDFRCRASRFPPKTRTKARRRSEEDGRAKARGLVSAIVANFRCYITACLPPCAAVVSGVLAT